MAVDRIDALLFDLRFPFRSFRSLINSTMSKRAFHGFKITSPFAFDPFQIPKSRAVCELVQHTNRDHVGQVGIACGDSVQLAVFSVQ